MKSWLVKHTFKTPRKVTNIGMILNSYKAQTSKERR